MMFCGGFKKKSAFMAAWRKNGLQKFLLKNYKNSTGST